MSVTEQNTWRISDSFGAATDATSLQSQVPVQSSREKTAAPSAAGSSLLAVGALINGSLFFERDCRIDGTVEGEITAKGRVTVGENALLKARIVANEVEVMGRVLGDIECEKRLHLKKGACVTGNISSETLVIDDGVVFEGFCSMTSRMANASEETETEAD